MADTKVSAETLVSSVKGNHKIYIVTDTGAAPDSGAARMSQVMDYIITDPNLCTNPGMQVWQNDTTITTIAHRGVLADGWLWGSAAGSSVWTGSRDTSVPDTSVPASIKMQCTTAEASPGSGVDRHIRWAVFGYDFEPHAAKDIVINFWVKAKKTGTSCIAVVNEARDRSYVREYTINAADTWEEKSVTIPFGSKTGSWNTGDGFGFGIRFTVVSGSTYQTTANAWQTGNFNGTSNQVNHGDNTANYFQISKVQVYPDAVPAFSLPTYDQALASAYRQYRVFTCNTGGVNLALGLAPSADGVNFDMPLGIAMMAPPEVSYKGTINTDFVVYSATGLVGSVTSLSSFARSKHAAKWTMVKVGGFTTGTAYLSRLETTTGKLVIDGHLA